jgi:hypothetical protein
MDIHSPGGTVHLYPAGQWARDQQALDARVFRRRVVVIDDWAGVPISDLCGDLFPGVRQYAWLLPSR